ncbi:hypothetical protein J6590_025707 [Homalodisca vitripennis]|nr:hypothetical protein J6590_025707 [Homalodisca vitripennis]
MLKSVRSVDTPNPPSYTPAVTQGRSRLQYRPVQPPPTRTCDWRSSPPRIWKPRSVHAKILSSSPVKSIVRIVRLPPPHLHHPFPTPKPDSPNTLPMYCDRPIGGERRAVDGQYSYSTALDSDRSPAALPHINNPNPSGSIPAPMRQFCPQERCRSHICRQLRPLPRSVPHTTFYCRSNTLSRRGVPECHAYLRIKIQHKASALLTSVPTSQGSHPSLILDSWKRADIVLMLPSPTQQLEQH